MFQLNAENSQHGQHLQINRIVTNGHIIIESNKNLLEFIPNILPITWQNVAKIQQ